MSRAAASSRPIVAPASVGEGVMIASPRPFHELLAACSPLGGWRDRPDGAHEYGEATLAHRSNNRPGVFRRLIRSSPNSKARRLQESVR